MKTLAAKLGGTTYLQNLQAIVQTYPSEVGARLKVCRCVSTFEASENNILQFIVFLRARSFKPISPLLIGDGRIASGNQPGCLHSTVFCY